MNVHDMLSHVVSWCYTHVRNLVCLCPRAKMILPRHTVKVIQSSWMYVTHCPTDMHSWPNMVLTQSHGKIPINLTLRSKVNIELGSWMFTSSHCDVLCARFDKPISKQKKLRSGHESAQIETQTDRQRNRRTERAIHCTLHNSKFTTIEASHMFTVFKLEVHGPYCQCKIQDYFIHTFSVSSLC